MTSQLQPREVELFRSLKKTAIVLMLLFRLDKPVGESEIARILDIHPETTRIYLRSLARLGLITRTHRFNGWTLTAGGRQMLLGESGDRWPVLGPGKIKTSAENPRSITESPTPSAEDPRSIPESPTSSAENPRSIPEGPTASAENPRATTESPTPSAENPRSIPEGATPSAENPRSILEGPTASAENPRSSAEIPRSPSLAAASLSLSFKQKRNTAAAAIARANVKYSRSSVKHSPSRYSRRLHHADKKDRTALGSARSDPVVRANLEAFASIGLARNDFLSEICKMDHVTPDYIRGQKKRLEAERRYSHGLLLTVIRSHDYLPEKYLAREEPEPQITENGQESEEESYAIHEIEPDPSIYEPISASGMTAAKAWSAVLGQLKVDMPKAAYDKWVRDAVLLSSKGGVFVLGAKDNYARDWLESRLSTTSRRLLSGICNRPVALKFVNVDELINRGVHDS
jgi:hypothetical protein